MNYKLVGIIAGSDSCGGGGIQGDLNIFSALADLWRHCYHGSGCSLSSTIAAGRNMAIGKESSSLIL